MAVDVSAWKAGTPVLCADGVERTDNEEQAALRMTFPHAVAHPQTFWFYGSPYRTGSRPKGSPNKLTSAVKTAMIIAAEIEGGKHIGAHPVDRLVAQEIIKRYPNANIELVGYFLSLIRQEPRTFGTIMGRHVPVQITGLDGGPIKIESRTPEELLDNYKRLGLPPPQELVDIVNKKASDAANVVMIEHVPNETNE